MSDPDPTPANTRKERRFRTPRRRRVPKGCAWGCGGTTLLGLLPIGLLLVVLNRVPAAYPAAADPLPPPAPTQYDGFGLDGFESPYLGHTGSWNGKGGSMWGESKVPDLEKETEMGLRWTFMPVYWRALEPGWTGRTAWENPTGMAGPRCLCHPA